MSTLKKWASAEQSSNLKHNEWDCQVDVLGAVGMAGIREGHAAVFRLKYMSDPSSYGLAVAQFKVWVKGAVYARRVRLPVSAGVFAEDVLKMWLDDVCITCQGCERVDKVCPDCRGSGKRQFKGKGSQVMITLDVFERADRTMASVGARIHRRLG